MSANESVPRVVGGMPWWLWVLTGLLTAAVLTGILVGKAAEDPEVLFERALVAASEENPSTFREMLNQLRRFESHRDHVTVLEGLDAGFTSRDAKAVRLLKPFLDHSNNRLRKVALRYSADSCQRMGDALRCQELYLSAIQLSPEDLQLRLSLAQLYQAVGMFQQALAESKVFLQERPDDQDALLIAARANMELGQLDEAIDTWQSTFFTPDQPEKAPIDKSMPHMTRYMRCLVWADRAREGLEYVNLGPQFVMDPVAKYEVLVASGETEPARGLLPILVGNDPSHPMSRRLDAEDAIRAEDWDTAIIRLTESMSRFPRERRFFEQLQRAAEESELPELAAAAAQNVEGINDLHQQLHKAVSAVGTDMTTADLRLDVVRLCVELAHMQQAHDWMIAAASVDAERQAEIMSYQLGRPTEPVVPITPDMLSAAVGESGSAAAQ